MGRIPQETIDQVLSSTDIVALIGERVALKRVGSRFRGLCPFHHEKTPSFYVDPNRQRFHCFGCGADGSAVGWLIDFENRSYPEAIQLLAKAAGIAIEEQEESAEERRARAGREAALGALAAACQHWSQRLWEDPAAATARAYLEKRGLDRATAEAWNFGHAEADSAPFLHWAKAQNLGGRALLSSGLASLRDENNPRAGLYARFRNRLMFPIRDGNGKIVGFSGRVLDPEAKTAKYVNTPETAFFRKGALLFGLDKARRPIIAAKRAILCEGQLDCIALHKAGFEESVAPLGTATTEEHARLLGRLADEVIILFDGDAAGAKAAHRAAEVLLPAGLAIRVANLPPGEDPDSFLAREGAETLGRLIEAAPDFFEHLFERHANEHDLATTEGRQGFAEAMVEGLRLVPDPVALEGLILKTAARLGVPDVEIRRRVEEARNRARRLARSQRAAAPAPAPSEEREAAEPEIPLPEHPLLRHLCLLLLLPESRAMLRERGDLLGALLDQLPGSQLPLALIEIDFDPAEAAAANRALDQLPATARRWLGQQMSSSPVATSEPGLQRKLAEENLARLEHLALKRQLQTRTSLLKGRSLDASEVLEVQRELSEFRIRLAEIESSGLLE